MQAQLFEILSGGTCDLQFNPLKTQTSLSGSYLGEELKHNGHAVMQIHTPSREYYVIGNCM